TSPMTRERLTITLRKDLLEKIDSLIDGQKIRNRSHAIESLLSKATHHHPVKVLILAGGKGVKDPDSGKVIPKAMLPIFGKPLLEHTITGLHERGLDDIVISCGTGSERIKSFFGTGEKFGVSLVYLSQDGLAPGTAQPLRAAQAAMGSGSFIVLYGDVLTDLNILDLLEFHKQQRGSIATMTLTSVEHVSMWGLARLQGSRIASFEEKPENPTTFSHLVNAGVYVMEPALFRYIAPDALKLERDVFPRLAEEGRLSGYAFDGTWEDVSDLSS
ncbi:MAG: sugar phosphate nucleotidyltransferase, partial [Thermodesulfobacteriota bacterium]